MAPTESLLIDVRTPSEYATGALSLHQRPAINIEYQLIDALPATYPAISKDAHITLYCRSGRRSGIALQMLKALGYSNVRDIGGLEEARAVLDRETVQRQLEEEEEENIGSEGNQGEKDKEKVKAERERAKTGKREQMFGKLIEGLRALDG